LYSPSTIFKCSPGNAVYLADITFKTPTMIQAGTAAPDFRLAASIDKYVSLSDFKGRNLIIAFYPADWSPVCTDQMGLYNNMLGYFSDLNAAIVGISVDSKWCHAAFSKDRNLSFPLLADFEPKGGISRAFGVYDEENGVSDRALFVIDGKGIVRWSFMAEPGKNPGADGIIDALEELQSSTK